MGRTNTENITRQQFIRWLSHERGITLQKATALYRQSTQAIRGGHAGSKYREFCKQCYKLFEVFVSDGPNDLDEAYRFHQEIHFLRMLSYSEPSSLHVTDLANLVTCTDSCTIVDFGCGLAQLSRALARKLSKQGIKVKLVLADIPTPRLKFLRFAAHDEKYSTSIIECTADGHVPALPQSNVIVATEFLEHVYNPMDYILRFHRALKHKGLLVTNLRPHQKEFMHVSPNLAKVSAALKNWNYTPLIRHEIFRKEIVAKR